MCIGDGPLDTIGPQEQERLRIAVAAAMPTYAFDVRSNAEGTNWIVLEPPAMQKTALRFTICRIAPSVMLMVEAPSGQRRFCSFEGVDGIVAFARSTSAATILAGAHSAHGVLQ